jgi:spore coat protein A, manganese oxidase
MRRSRQPQQTIERRKFLKLAGAAVGGAVVLGSAGMFVRARRADAQVSLRPFVDALPVPRVITPDGRLDGDPLYLVTMQVFRQKLHRDLPPTTLWGYNAQYPGPTFEARRGHPIAVRWMNHLPNRHMFPIDETLHGVGGEPAVRTVVHLHGHKVLPESDGYPEAWFTNNFAQTGPFFELRTYRYPNDQAATQLWYHDHALGATRLNNYAGLSGVYLLRDRVEDDLNLPDGPFEIPLIIQDRFFNPDGSLLYPVIDDGGDPDPRVPPVWIPEFFGDTVLVNGKVWPVLEVEPRKYRFRILNASNARFYHLTLNEARGATATGRPGPPFIQIGTDGGFLPAPVRLTDLTIGVAERFDVIIDFSGAEGQSFILNNDAKAPFPDGDDVVPENVMMFKVARRLSSRDTSSIPRSLAPVPLLDPRSSVATRDLVLTELDSAAPFENPIIALINAPWADPVTETPRAGSVELWRIINTTGDAHPIHIHLIQFQILDRQPFDTEQYPGRLVFTGPRVPAPANERPAFKDTIKALPGEVSRVIARFDLPSGTPTRRGQKFRYVFHCHILEHEDNDMMRPYDVVG